MSSDEFERILRATLAGRAGQAPDPDELSSRVLRGIDASAGPGDRPAGRGGRGGLVSMGAVRSRQRRLTRVLVPLASAAAVAAIVALGLVISHQDTAEQSAGSRVAAGQIEPSPRPAISPPGGRSAESGSAAAAPTAQAGASKTADSAGAKQVPTSFQITDLSFDSPRTGFALGTLSCSAGLCPALVRAVDATTWNMVSDNLPFGIATSTPAKTPTVTNIRFATASVGYAYGPDALFMTGDGGSSWTQEGTSADALEVADGTVVRVSHGGCNPTCTFTVSLAGVGAGDFAPVQLPGGVLRGSGVALARAGANVFLAARTQTGRAETFLSSSDGGRSWSRREADLCGGESAGTAPARVISLAAAADGSVTALCSTAAARYTVTSADDGVTFTVGTPIPLGPGPVTMVAVASAKTIVAGGAGLYRSADAGRTWAVVAGVSSPGSTRFLGFQSESIGRWVGGAAGSVWTTVDAGSSYSEYAFG